MQQLELTDIQNILDYERSRSAFRTRIIALKKLRRVPVGDTITFVFENRETVRFQVQEMARIERMVDDAQIQGELDIYNALIPAEGTLSATLLVDITDQSKIRATLDSLVGMHHHVALEIGDDRIAAEFDPSQFTDDRISAVQYIRFPLSPAQRTAFANMAVPVRLAIDHPRLSVQQALSDATRRELAVDLDA